MRNRINEAYGGRWVAVKTMGHNQVVAIYNSMKSRGKFDKPTKAKNKLEGTQLSIFDVYGPDTLYGGK